MIRVGQCEGCECWYRARNLTAVHVAKPLLAAREHAAEFCGSIPGLEPAPLVAYFCPECLGAIESPGEEESLIWKPGDPLPDREATRSRPRLTATEEVE